MRRSSAGLAELMRAGALWMSCWAREKGEQAQEKEDQAQEKGISLCPRPVGVGILLAASTEPPQTQSSSISPRDLRFWVMLKRLF